MENPSKSQPKITNASMLAKVQSEKLKCNPENTYEAYCQKHALNYLSPQLTQGMLLEAGYIEEQRDAFEEEVEDNDSSQAYQI